MPAKRTAAPKDSSTAIRFIEADIGKEQFVSEAKNNFRKDYDVPRQWSGATWTTPQGCPEDERGGVHQFGVPPKGNANFACFQHLIHHLAPHGTADFVFDNGPAKAEFSNQSGEGDMRTIFQHRFCQTSYASIAA